MAVEWCVHPFYARCQYYCIALYPGIFQCHNLPFKVNQKYFQQRVPPSSPCSRSSTAVFSALGVFLLRRDQRMYFYPVDPYTIYTFAESVSCAETVISFFSGEPLKRRPGRIDRPDKCGLGSDRYIPPPSGSGEIPRGKTPDNCFFTFKVASILLRSLKQLYSRRRNSRAAHTEQVNGKTEPG